MPEISRFLGIVITMHYRDHLPPHFHAHYGEYHVAVSLEDGSVEGRFPRRALGHVLEWYTRYQEELRANWRLAEQRLPLERVPPLE